MAVYSHSKLDTFRTCPRKFYYRYVAKVPLEEEPEQIAPFLGSRVHESLEFLYQSILQARTPELAEVLEHFRATWRAEWSKNVVVPKGRTSREFQSIAERCLRDYYTRHAPFDESRVIALEQKITFPLDHNQNHQIQGYVDRISRKADGTWQINDYKTNSRLPTQAHKDADPQLAFYEIGIRQMWRDVEQVELVWHFLQFDVQIVSRRSNGQLEALKQQTLETISEIESRPRSETSFPTHESGLCQYCEYQPVCPLFRHLYEVRSLPPSKFLKQPGVKLVNRWAELKAEMDVLDEQKQELQQVVEEIQAALKVLAEREQLERVVGSEKEVVVTRKTETIFPRKTKEPDEAEELETKLRGSRWWNEASTLDRAALVKLWNNQANLPAELRKLLQRFVMLEPSISVRLRNRKE